MSTNGKLTSVLTLGPRDHGRRMSLREFEFAKGKEGYRYELSRGFVTVMNVPRFRHLRQVEAIRDQAVVYKIQKQGVIVSIASSMEGKLLVWDFESERHPDLSIYLTQPPKESKEFWTRWVPEIVVEVVSRGSRKRDYQEKPEEYLAIGVKEYWIVDADEEKITVMQRSRGKWKEKVLGRDDTHKTKLLPGFELICRVIFEAAEKS